jgi:hypothetical protein
MIEQHAGLRGHSASQWNHCVNEEQLPIGRLVAASGIGGNGVIARDIRLAEMLIAKLAKPDPPALSSPDVKLKSLLR